METEWRDVDRIALLSEVHKMKAGGWRLAQICATRRDGGFVLLYTFVKESVTQLRVTLNEADEVESIGRLYEYAFLYENEMKDLFGVNVADMNLDFHGNLYKTSIKTPFGIIKKEEAAE